MELTGVMTPCHSRGNGNPCCASSHGGGSLWVPACAGTTFICWPVTQGWIAKPYVDTTLAVVQFPGRECCGLSAKLRARATGQKQHSCRDSSLCRLGYCCGWRL